LIHIQVNFSGIAHRAASRDHLWGTLTEKTRPSPVIKWKHTAATGVAVSIVIELLQPIVGRSFDINDII
jgi:hypothetical protein